MTTLVFGHKSPDTDSTGSPLIWAWFLNHTGTPAEARLLGTPNTEARFVAERWGFDLPAVLTDVEPGQPVVIVDTNNPAELPAGHRRGRHPRDHRPPQADRRDRDQGSDRRHDPAARLHRDDPVRPDGRPGGAHAGTGQGAGAQLHPVRHAGIPLAHHDPGRPGPRRTARRRARHRHSPLRRRDVRGEIRRLGVLGGRAAADGFQGIQPRRQGVPRLGARDHRRPAASCRARPR